MHSNIVAHSQFNTWLHGVVVCGDHPQLVSLFCDRPGAVMGCLFLSPIRLWRFPVDQFLLFGCIYFPSLISAALMAFSRDTGRLRCEAAALRIQDLDRSMFKRPWLHSLTGSPPFLPSSFLQSVGLDIQSIDCGMRLVHAHISTMYS